MMQGNLDELTLTGVFDRGVPNSERVAIRVNQHVDLASFVLLQGVTSPAGGTVPIRDSMFWFGNGLLQPSDWIFVYTATGEPSQSPIEGGGKLVILHWQRSQTMFHAPSVVPILARIDALLIAPPAPAMTHAVPAGQGLLGGVSRSLQK